MKNEVKNCGEGVEVAVCIVPSIVGSGYCVRFFEKDDEGTFSVPYNPGVNFDYEYSILPRYLHSDYIVLGDEMFFLPRKDLSKFVLALSSGTGDTEFDLVTSGNTGAMLVIRTSDRNFFDRDGKEEEIEG